MSGTLYSYGENALVNGSLDYTLLTAEVDVTQCWQLRSPSRLYPAGPVDVTDWHLTKEGIKLAGEIKGRIGKPKAFYGHDRSVPSFRAVYDSPHFDFSELLPIPQLP